MNDATTRALDPDCAADPMTRMRVALLVVAGIALAAFRVWARARTAWDWDESLFALAGPGAWREPGLRVVGAARVAAP